MPVMRHVLVKVVISIVLLLWGGHLAHGGSWKPLKKDGTHDPKSPGLELRQEPEKALSPLPSDTAGNKVNWIKALNEGAIKPRSALLGHKKIQVLDLNIIFSDTAGHPRVVFPHKPHTQWLDCENCHEKLFKFKAGATPVSMGTILNGEHCGVCHGAVAFPLTECNRCHVLREDE